MKGEDYIRKFKDAERRYFPGDVVIEKRADGTNSNVIEGYAAVFNKYSQDLGGFQEIIEPGAFTDVLNDDVFGLWNHDEDAVLGRNGRNMTITQDNVGLKYRIELPDTATANEVRTLIEKKIIDQSSFAFHADVVEWTMQGENKTDVRRIKHFSRLYDVSPVTYAAYLDSTVATRSKPAPDNGETLKADLAKVDQDKMKMEMDLRN
jgi:HK97 family phage prohead protease